METQPAYIAVSSAYDQHLAKEIGRLSVEIALLYNDMKRIHSECRIILSVHEAYKDTHVPITYIRDILKISEIVNDPSRSFDGYRPFEDKPKPAERSPIIHALAEFEHEEFKKIHE